MEASNIIYQEIVGTFPQLDRDMVVALSETIAQALPQPLEDKKLRGKIAEAIYKEFTYYPKNYRIYACADQILALLQPRIEEAIRQERERIFAWGNEDCPHNHTVKLKVKRGCIACWQALKGEK